MASPDDITTGPFGPISRRSAIGSALHGRRGVSRACRHGRAGSARPGARGRRGSGYDMKKSINLWAFPYPRADDLERVPAAREGRRASTASS